jgi:AcrR family transcriptional regulator
MDPMSPAQPARTRGPKPTKVDPDQLLAAAQVVFAEQGLQATSLRAIARQAGCDPALIYYHFASKEALFNALLERRFPAVLVEVERLADPLDRRPTAQRLWEVLLIFHRHLGEDPGLRSLVRGEIVKGAEGITALIEAQVRPVIGAVRRIFEQGLLRGELRADLQPTLATFFLVKMQLEILDVLPVMLPRLMDLPQEAAVATGMRAWFELFWRGVALDPSSPLPILSPLPPSSLPAAR